MRAILPEFVASMARIRNNFYFSFLALNFVNLRPFTADVTLPVNMAQNVMTSSSLNSFDQDGIQEHGNSIRRHFLNDMVIAYERYSMLMIASHNNSQQRIDPALVNNRQLGAHLFEQLANVYEPDELRFLIQLRRFRNSIVHYNGVYSATNELDYTFDTQSYHSIGHEGQNIAVEFDTLLWIYDKLKMTVESANARYLAQYPLP